MTRNFQTCLNSHPVAEKLDEMFRSAMGTGAGGAAPSARGADVVHDRPEEEVS
jgi:hypothetical protein